MQVVLEIRNPTDVQLLLQYVKLLSSARVVDTQAKRPNAATLSKPFFDRHFGALLSAMTPEEIDAQLKTLRDGWERATW
jgi:hypothetical protein